MTAGYQPRHQQVQTTFGAFVDVGMAPLLEALWARGLTTMFSCQEQVRRDPDDIKYAYIAFADNDDAVTFFSETVRTCDLDDHYDTVRLESGGHRGWVNFRTDRIDAITKWWKAIP